VRGLYFTLAGLAAVAALVLVNGHEAPKRTASPQAIVRSTSGSFTQSNSRAGMPIFKASNVGPGDSVSGEVTITNTGTVKGYFYLSQAQLTDAVGPGGGALSGRLRLTVLDVTNPGAPKTVYSGPFATMDAQPLGFIAPKDARRYSFSALFLDGGTPPAATAGDNALKGSSTSVRYVWSALGDAPRRDRRPPRLRVSIPRVQRILQNHYLRIRARCSEACRIGVTGTVQTRATRRVPTLRIRNRRARAHRTMKLNVKIPRRMWKPVDRALRRSAPATIRLKVTARDEAGNLAVVKRIVRLKPLRRR
jgi:hypothetical protein